MRTVKTNQIECRIFLGFGISFAILTDSHLSEGKAGEYDYLMSTAITIAVETPVFAPAIALISTFIANFSPALIDT